MKTPLLTVLALGMAALSTPILYADDAAKAKPAAAHKEETELGGKMDELGGAMRKLKKQIADPAKQAENLTLIAKIKDAAAASATLTPAMAADIPEAERAKFIADYQAAMKKFLVSVSAVEAAIKDGKTEDAGKLLGELGAQMKSGHKQFKKPDSK